MEAINELAKHFPKMEDHQRIDCLSLDEIVNAKKLEKKNRIVSEVNITGFYFEQICLFNENNFLLTHAKNSINHIQEYVGGNSNKQEMESEIYFQFDIKTGGTHLGKYDFLKNIFRPITENVLGNAFELSEHSKFHSSDYFLQSAEKKSITSSIDKDKHLKEIISLSGTEIVPKSSLEINSLSNSRVNINNNVLMSTLPKKENVDEKISTRRSEIIYQFQNVPTNNSVRITQLNSVMCTLLPSSKFLHQFLLQRIEGSASANDFELLADSWNESCESDDDKK